MKFLHSREKETAETAEKFRLPLSAYLCYLLVATLLFTGVSFSKFASAAGGSDTARVAKFSVDAAAYEDNTLTMNCKSIINAGADSYIFTVTSDSEVTVSYDVMITLNKALPEGVDMTLVKGDEHTPCTLTGSGRSFTAKNVCTIAAGTKQTDTYKLHFEEQTSNSVPAPEANIRYPADTYPENYSWTPTETSDSYNVTVKICASQVD